MYLGIVITLALLAGVLTACIHGAPRLARWGSHKGAAVTTGVSPYREAGTRPNVLNGAPGGLRVVAGINTFWGVVTGLVFAPAGCLLFYAAEELKLLIAPLLVVVVSGFCLAFALGFASARVLRRVELDKARRTLNWSMAHHIGVLLFMALASLVLEHAFLVAIAAVPCVLGMTFAHLLLQGIEQIELGRYDQDAYS